MAEHRAAQTGRILTKSAHEIAVIVAHERIGYGTMIGALHGGEVLRLLKKAIFEATRAALVEFSTTGEHRISPGGWTA